MNKKKIWIYRKHPCIAALQNINRKCYELLVTENFIKHNNEIQKIRELSKQKTSIQNKQI